MSGPGVRESRGERRRGAIRVCSIVLGCLLAALIPSPAHPADVITDGDMEAAGIGDWPHTDITDTNSSAKASDQSASGQSLKGTSAAGKKVDVGWYNAQTVGVINDTDTVLLSLWWGYRFNVNIGQASGTLFFDIKPASGAWTNVWSLAATPNATVQTGTVPSTDISASFATTESYDIRVRFEGGTGNNNSANVDVWWDNVVLDVTSIGGADSLTASANAPIEAAGQSQGTSGIVMQRFQVDSDTAGNGQIALTSLTLGDAGTAVAGDIDTVRVYIDTDNTFAGSTEIGNAAFSTDPITVTLNLGTPADRTVTNPTPKYIFVVYDLNAAATIGNTIRSSVTDVGVAGPDNGDAGLVGFNSTELTILGPTPDNLTASANAPIEAADQSQGTSGIVMQRFQVDSDTAGNGQIALTSLTLGDAGTAVAGDIDTVRVYIDTDNTFAGSTEIGTVAFSTDPITVTLNLGTPADRTVTNPTPKYIFVVYDLNAAATIGNTIRSSVTDVGVAGPDNGDAGLVGFNSTELTILGPTPDNLTASANAPIEAADQSQGTSGIVMQRFQVDSDTAGNGQIALTSLTLGDAGTAAAGDIDTVRVYIDTDNTFAGSTEIGNVAFSTDPITVTLNLGTPADRTVTNPTPKYIFVVYDLNAAATIGNTIRSSVTDVGVAGPDNGDASLVGFNSNTLTIQAASINGTTVVSNSAVASSCNQITVTSVFTGDADGDGTTLVEVRVPPAAFATACATLSGASPRQCLVTQGVTPGSTHEVRVTFGDPDGVAGANPQVIGSLAVPTCGADAVAPTVLFLAPRRDAVLGGRDWAKVQVFDADGLAGTDPVKWSIDGGVLSATGVTTSGNYDCGATCTVYELDLNTTVLSNGSHYLTVQVTDAAGPPANVAAVSRGFRVSNLAGRPRGSGHLLRRTAGSQVCIDCHNLPTHSSQSTSTQYGNWAVECFDCHTPHRTRNIYLIREALPTPNSGTAIVDFRFNADVSFGYLGDTSGASNSPYGDGICEACHTQTDYHRNTSGGNHTHNVGGGQSCIECHAHGNGFSGGGGGCLGCHGNTGDIGTTGPNSRRPVNPDFTLQSHHVGNGGTMGGGLTDFDCVVCHGEGIVNAGATETKSPEHNNGVIDLKDADTLAIYSYDKSSMPAAPEDWNSSNPTWRSETSTRLDPFCLSCHDGDGASASFNATDLGNASNPFGDTAITNNYDQVDRGSVVDIKSKVTATTDQDTDPGRDAQNIPDPPGGIFSRHAIRGQSLSVYVAYQNIGAADDYTMYEGDPTASQSLLTSMGTAEGTPLWNDTSVMGCADCHTTDGANGVDGNAHGSGSEYLLKDASGLATEGTLAARSYVCYRCHKSGRYEPPNALLGNHTGNGGDWQDKTGLTGIDRKTDGKGSNIFANACLNCHGGFGFGSIHGTSDVIGIGTDGGGVGAVPDREAYRFMNGAGLRFYDPGDWTTTSVSCYTLSKNTTPDTWGDCTQHNGAGWTRKLKRPLSY